MWGRLGKKLSSTSNDLYFYQPHFPFHPTAPPFSSSFSYLATPQRTCPASDLFKHLCELTKGFLGGKHKQHFAVRAFQSVLLNNHSLLPSGCVQGLSRLSRWPWHWGMHGRAQRRPAAEKPTHDCPSLRSAGLPRSPQGLGLSARATSFAVTQSAKGAAWPPGRWLSCGT